ncbi:MAG: SCP2 sterol-binding domain-containing protein [Alphaproteobacteria bacterium]|nr:SCP2 sterol-binding domain-containing protein [Alphaproteobacteria bacterium]
MIRFELEGPGGGVWCLKRRGTRVHLVDHPTNPDCLLRCSTADFHALLTGSLDATEGFMSGRLEVAGDVGIVLGLHEALRSDG